MTVHLDNIPFQLPKIIAFHFFNKVTTIEWQLIGRIFNLIVGFKGPCPPGNVVSFAKNGRLECASSQCPSSPDPLNPLIFVRENGFCYEWGTTGPCRPPTELLGYDVFQLKAKCVDLTDRLSPYFWSPEEDKLLDSVFDQLSAEYDDLRISFVQQIGRNVTLERRQEQNTLGVFQVSSSLPDVLLNPCRPGVQRSLNYKCTNPIL